MSFYIYLYDYLDLYGLEFVWILFKIYWMSSYIYFYDYLDLYGFEFVWTLFKIYDNDVFYFILFEFMIKYLYFK